MIEPHSPAAPPRWKRILHTVLLALAGALGLTYGLLLVLHDAEPAQLTPMLLLFLAVALAIGALTHEMNIARSEARLMAHIDLRVSEVAGRMDRRLAAITNAMVEHGIQLQEITGEIPRVREAVANHSHPVQLSGYDQGYADGAAGRPIAAKMRVIGRQ